MTDREYFRLAVLTTLARDGLTPAQAAARVAEATSHVKSADGPVSWGATAFKWPLIEATLLTGLGAVGGAGTGYLLAKATEKDIDPEEVRKQELLAAYRQHTDRIRRNIRRIKQEQIQQPIRGGNRNGI